MAMQELCTTMLNIHKQHELRHQLPVEEQLLDFANEMEDYFELLAIVVRDMHEENDPAKRHEISLQVFAMKGHIHAIKDIERIRLESYRAVRGQAR